MSHQKKVLIVEDNPPMAETFQGYLHDQPYQVLLAETGGEALSLIANQKVDGILLDLKLPDMNGMEILKRIRKENINCAVVVITGETTMSTAIEAMREGASDFIAKPVSPERLTVSLSNAIKQTELEHIATAYEKISRKQFCEFLGKSPEMHAVYHILESAAKSKAPAFITGESGTGKELAAQAIHKQSKRANEPLEILNCAAIPRELLESEIFGHKKGSFTGAIADHVGAAKRADGGTLFLDEIGEMPIELQAKLLRLIQSGTFTAVGGRGAEQVDIRFICATNRDPLEAIKKGLLREDLYYRLNVIPVHLPPLRDRGQDIILLAQHFLEEASQEEEKSFTGFDKKTEAVLMAYSWPGNVRQLQNIIHRSVIMNDGDVLKPEMLPALDIVDGGKIDQVEVAELGGFLPLLPEDILPLRQYERRVIEASLKACGGNITEAAKYLDINPATIHRKQKSWS